MAWRSLQLLPKLFLGPQLKEKVLNVLPSFWEITMGQEATVATVSRSKPRLKETGLYGQYELELSMKVGFLL